MAEDSESNLNVAGCFNVNGTVDGTGWTVEQHPASHQKRSDIVPAIIQNWHTDHLRTILDMGWDVNETLYMHTHTQRKKTTALHEASRRGWAEGVKQLFAAGANYKAPGVQDTPLQLALQNPDCPADVVEVLLKYGADPNVTSEPWDTSTPLQLALQKPACPVDVVQLLLEHGADPNRHEGVTIPLFQALSQIVSGYQISDNFCRIFQVLLENGADPNVTSEPWDTSTPLQMVLQNPACPTDVVELLLKHGADPNHHDGATIPLFQALFQIVSGYEINHNFTRIVEVLLENGADPNVTYKSNPPLTALDKVLNCLFTTFKGCINECNENAAFFKTLLQFGADINCNAPLLHKMLGSMIGKVWVGLHSDYRMLTSPNHVFLHEHLDLYFQYGGNIHKDFSDQGTGLEFAIRHSCHSNSIRWLIRHGADTSTLQFTDLGHILVSHKVLHAAESPLILLQAGMRVPSGTRQCLMDIQSESLYDGEKALWEKLKEEETWKRHAKHIFLDNLKKQMVDLEEFSDGSLQVYPEVNHQGYLHSNFTHPKEFTMDQIHLVLEFLSQPQSLQLYCRRCVRENLVSLQPSVVKTLPLPSNMKRYILCHEI